MTDDFDSTDADQQALADLLADPAMWEEPAAGTEDAVVAAIAAEAGGMAPAAPDVEPSGAEVIPISRGRRWAQPFAAGVAAALLVLGGLAVTFAIARDDTPAGVELALESSDLAPEATATAFIDETPLGTRIILDVTGLPPAAPGTYYEAWMRVDADIGVSAGTFHFRGGDGEVELWSGVPLDDYPLFTVTIQDEAEPTSSGVVVLRGRLGES